MTLRRFLVLVLAAGPAALAGSPVAGAAPAAAHSQPAADATSLTAALESRVERERARAILVRVRWAGSLSDLGAAVAADARAESLYDAALAALDAGPMSIPRAVVGATGPAAVKSEVTSLVFDLAARGRWKAADALLSGALRSDARLRPLREWVRARHASPRAGLLLLGWPPDRQGVRRPGPGEDPADQPNFGRWLSAQSDLTLWVAAALSDSAGAWRDQRAALWVLVERAESAAVRKAARLALARRLFASGESRLAASVLEREPGRSIEETTLLARILAAGGDTLSALGWLLDAVARAPGAAERYAAAMPAARAVLAGRADSLEEGSIAALATALGNLGEADLALRLLDARRVPAGTEPARERGELRASLLLKARRFDDAARAYRGLLAGGEVDPSGRAALALGLARALRGARAFEAMDSAFVLAASLAPAATREAAAWERAREWEDRRPPGEAAPVLAWAMGRIDTGPLATAVRVHTALAWDRAGRIDSARAVLGAGGAGEGPVWFWRARFALAGGDTAGARVAFERAARAQPLSYEGVRAREELGLSPLLEAPGVPPRPARVPARAASPPGPGAALAEIVGLPALAMELLRGCAQDAGEPAANGCVDALEARGLYRSGRRTPATELRLTRPPAHARAVLGAAAAEGVDAGLLWSLMLQESAFDAKARSRAGAIGLLQLLPSTASRLAGREIPTDSLVDPALNVRLAARYVGALLREFRDPRGAMAAYNAGEDAVRRWLAERSVIDDRWVELIPYRETRDYVKSVYTTWRQYAAVYAAR